MPGDHGRSKPGDPPTERQADALLMLRLLTAWRGVAPTTREVARAMLVVQNRVAELMRALRRKGLVTWEPGRARTLRALSPPAAAAQEVASTPRP